MVTIISANPDPAIAPEPGGAAAPSSRLVPAAQIAALIGVIVVGVLLRVHYATQPLKYDEAVTLTAYVRQPLWAGLSEDYAPNNHLLHTLLAHVSVRWFGDREWALRLPALVAGVAMIPAVFLAARRVFGRSAALPTAALVATSSALVDYSTNARGYTLVGLAFLVLLACADALRRRGGDGRGAWVAFAVVVALGFFTIPVMLLPFGAAAGWLAASAAFEDPAPRRRLLRGLARATALAAGLTLLLYVPPLSESGWTAVVYNRYVQPLGLGEAVASLPGSFGQALGLWRRDVPLPIQVALALGLIASVATYRLPGRRENVGRAGARVHPLVIAGAWCVVAMVAQQVSPPPRAWLFLLPLAFAAGAAGIAELCRRVAGWAPGAGLSERVGAAVVPVLAVAIAAWMGWRTFTNDSPLYSAETGILPDAPQIARDLAAMVQPGDRIIAVVPADEPLWYYCARAGLSEELWPRGNRTARMVWVVVLEPEQSVKSVLRRMEFDDQLYRPPRLVKQYPRASLYRLPLRSPRPTTTAATTTAPIPAVR